MTRAKIFRGYQWFLRFLSFGIMMQTLFFKFTAAPESVYIFTQVGMEPWGRLGTGMLELVASIALLFTPWAWLGALLSTVVMFGALFSHFTLLGFEVQGDGGLLFGLAVVNFAASVQTLFFQRGQIPLAGALLQKLSERVQHRGLHFRNIRLGFLFIGVCLAIASIGIFEQAYTIKKLLEISQVSADPVRDLAQIAYFLTIVGVLLAFILAILLLRIAGRPIAIFTEVCDQILHGSKTARVQVGSGAEWGLMAASFNNMLQEIQRKDSNMNSLLKGIPDAVFFFDRDGRISQETSGAALQIFPKLQQCQNIVDFFISHASLDAADAKGMLTLIWSNNHNFETLTDLLPKKLHLSDTNVSGGIQYRAELDPHRELTRVIVVGTDLTAQELASRETSKQIEKVQRISAIGSSVETYLKGEADIFKMFVDVQGLVTSSKNNSLDRGAAKRVLHSLKGSLSFFHFSEIAYIIHGIETDLEDGLPVEGLISDLQKAEGQFKSESKDICEIFNLNEEKKWTKVSTEKLNDLKRKSINAGSELSAQIIALDEQHPSQLFMKYSRYLKTLSERDGSKLLKLRIHPSSDEVNPSDLSSIENFFGHILRNSFDHGLEAMEMRNQLGKPPEGLIEIQIRKRNSNQLEIRIRDDGKGIQVERLVQKAVAKGLWSPTKAAQATEQEKINLIFIPGLSTQDEISESAGRGVGMDVVKNEIEKLGGTILVKTQLKQGTEFTICIPRQLAG